MAGVLNQGEVKFYRAWQTGPNLQTEPGRARAWRERLGWSRARLARATGYSVGAIVHFETGEPRSVLDWRKYRMACLGAWCESAQAKWEWL